MPANEFSMQDHTERHSFNRNSTLWRYMPLPNFIKTVFSRSLWFNRADKFDDTFEGSVSEPTFNRSATEFGEEATDSIQKIRVARLQAMFISCWQRSDRENALMWSAYAPQGVAVQTTYSKLAAALPEQVHIGLVRYADFNKDLITPYPTTRYFTKRDFFADEREVRVLFHDAVLGQRAEYDQPVTGRNFVVDLDSLLNSIVCRPYASADEIAMIRKIAEASGLAVPVKESSLSGTPKYA